MELEFEQMEIENNISNSGLEERSSVSLAKKNSSHFDKRKFRDDLNKLKLNNSKIKRKNPTYSAPVKFSHHTTAVGRDPTLVSGPNPNIAAGPNFEICKGPNPDFVAGSCGAVGPDPTIRIGYKNCAISSNAVYV